MKAGAGRSKRGSALSASLSALLLAGSSLAFAPTAAHAQDALQKRPDPVADDTQEIIVSARRKDEKLTDVPASITAFSADYLKTQNIQDFSDYANRVPNLSFQYGQDGTFQWAGDRETTIRGVAGNGTTAYYINDTPVPSSVSPLTLDLDRIEVLKGPQGTLFGASSMGGNLRFITHKPSFDETSGAAQLQAGGTKAGGFDGQGNAQASIVLAPGRVALDIAGGYTRDSGFTTRQFRDASGTLISKGGQGRDDTFMGSATLRAKLTDNLEASLNAIGQATKLHGFPSAYLPLPGYKPISYTMDRDADIQEFSKDRWGLGSFVLNYGGDHLSIVSSTSYFARSVYELEDDTEGSNQYLVGVYGTDFGHPAIYQQVNDKENRFTHEDRISFDEGALLPHLSGIAGVFYQHTYSHNWVPEIHIRALADGGLSPDFFGSTSSPTHSDEKAIFGELYYELVPKLTVTLGLRQYWTKQRTDASTDRGLLFGPTASSFNPERKDKESGLVPKAVLSYKIGDQGNIYASVSKGFRPGGSSVALPDFCSADLANLGLTRSDVAQYKSDSLWNYEIGAKSRLADGRLSASVAAFQINWSHIQQTTFLPTCLLAVTTNAGKARIRGGEMELAGRPLAGVPLSIEVGLGYTDGVLQEPGVLPEPANSPLPQVPKWTGTISANYDTPLTDKLRLFVAADYSYSGSIKVADGMGGFYTRHAIDMVNGNIGLSFGRSQVMVFAKNLLDKRLTYGDQPAASFERQDFLPDGTPQRLPRGVVSRPRQIGIQYQYNF
jgi:outer membrane receptor protein involved in Fe transport